jgi:cytochrome c-type biogenesis protein CcsB
MTNLMFNLARALHIPLLLGSYVIFGAAFAVGLAYLWEERQVKSKHLSDLTFQLPSLDRLDRMISRLILMAVPFLTIGILLGGVWAQRAWGRFWGWDPKETWALITWLVYVTYLIVRWVIGWRGRKTTYFSLAGFAIVLFTYVGVNYMSPLHQFLTMRNP